MAVKLTRQKPVVERSRVGATRRKPTDPDFESVFDDGDEDMFAGVEMTGELQEDADTRMSEALRQIIERKKATQERFRVATDPDFYSVICFQSREQRDDFLTKAGWREFGTAFLNGLDVLHRSRHQPCRPSPRRCAPCSVVFWRGSQLGTLHADGKPSA